MPDYDKRAHESHAEITIRHHRLTDNSRQPYDIYRVVAMLVSKRKGLDGHSINESLTPMGKVEEYPTPAEAWSEARRRLENMVQLHIVSFAEVVFHDTDGKPVDLAWGWRKE